MKEDKKVKKTRKPRTVKSPETKLLEECKEQTKVLREIKDILNNMWRDRQPDKED